MAISVKEQPVSSGIDALIERLKLEGVSEGETAAKKIVADAKAEAAKILADAEAEARRRRDAAAAEAVQLKRGGEEALKVAMRDAVLQLKEEMGARFAAQVGSVIGKLTADEDMVRKMILAVASRARDEAGLDDARALDLILPRSAASLEDLRRNTKELKEGSLSQLVLALAADMLRDGITFSYATADGGGITAVMKDDGVQVDLTEKAVADVILRHLQPRFRALLEGVVS